MSKRIRYKLLKNMGLVLNGDKAMAYGFQHGAMQWAPEWVKKAICHSWNVIACCIRGHDPLALEMYIHHAIPGRPTCFNCSAILKVNGKHVTDAELEAHDDICYAEFEARDANSDNNLSG